MTQHFGIVAGEESGDILGAGLIQALKQHFPQARFSGIGGTRMLAEGMQSLYPIDRLSVMGLVEPLKRLPELLRIRKNLKQHFVADKPDVFIGIDSPDFNLDLEKYLKEQGIKTCHYVSPSVWAWRQKRIHKIAKAVDMMLTLLPFEAEFYQQHNIPVSFVGHPLADEFPLQPDVSAARRALALSDDDTVLAVLPGSRAGEIRLLMPVFSKVIAMCLEQLPDLKVVFAAVNEQRKAEIQQVLEQTFNSTTSLSSHHTVQIVVADSRNVMTASDVVLLASGTATLEAMLLKKPMLVSYKMAPLSYAIISRMLKVPFVALPNLLAGKAEVPELLQKQASPENIVAKLLPMLKKQKDYQQQRDLFLELHKTLKQNANQTAAQAVLSLCENTFQGNH